MSDMIPAKDGIDAAVTDLAHQIKDAPAPETTPDERLAGRLGRQPEPSRSGMDHGGAMMGEAEVDDLENVSGAEAAKLFLSRWLAWFGFSFGCLPHRRPFALATYMPSRVPQPDQIRLELCHHLQHVGPGDPEKAMARSSTDGRPTKVTFAARLKWEIGLKKEGHWSLRCVTGQLTCVTSAPSDTQRAASSWWQGDRREPADGR